MKVAITGGIGSGKSYVCRILEKHGVKVYDCDAGAKRLMRSDAQLQMALRKLVGDEVYRAETVSSDTESVSLDTESVSSDTESSRGAVSCYVLQKPVLAKFLLASEENKQAVNDVVHPAVARDFEQSGYDWLESAILFDSGFDRRTHFDYVVCVTAPVSVRLQRIMQRDHITEEKAQEWIDAVMPQEQLVARSDFEIVNDGVGNVEEQVERLLASLSE